MELRLSLGQQHGPEEKNDFSQRDDPITLSRAVYGVPC